MQIRLQAEGQILLPEGAEMRNVESIEVGYGEALQFGVSQGTYYKEPEQLLTEAFEAGKREQADELEAARAEIATARRTAEYWKANHLAGNEQLAAEQAKNAGLREALHYSLGAWEYDGISDEHGSIFQEACSRCDAPSDTSALEAMIAKAGEVMREQCADYLDRYGEVSQRRSEEIRALPAVTLEDLK